MPEVAIIGGGPAGLAVAIEARKAGLSATVLERAKPPQQKACGEGLALAFQQAPALVEALRSGDLGRYRKAHKAIVRGPMRSTRLLLAIRRHPRLRTRMVEAFAAAPQAFSRILAMHNGTITPLEIGWRNALALGAGFLPPRPH